MDENKVKTEEKDIKTRAEGDDAAEQPLDRREALRRLGKYSAATFTAPAVITLLVSGKASASSHEPPPPPFNP